MKLQENTIFANRYELKRLIGRGGFAEVWLATDSMTHMPVALKVYAPGNGMDEDGLGEFCAEMANVHHLHHSNLLKPSHLDIWGNMPYMTMDYCPNGSLSKKVGKLSEEEIWKVIKDVAAGLAYLHENDIIHQDIKPDNILQNEAGMYCITDFGISAKARTTLRKSVIGASNGAGTMAYMGPERFSKNPSPVMASDIWSFGSMLYELVTGDVPFGELGGGMQKSGAEIPDITQNVSNKLKALIVSMLDVETYKRPTAKDILNSFEKKTPSTPFETRKPIENKSTNKLMSNVKYIIMGIVVILIAGSVWLWDYNRVKVTYYRDYVEKFGVPEGIGKISSGDRKHTQWMYMFESKHYKVFHVARVNNQGNIKTDSETERKERPDNMQLIYKDGKLHRINVMDANNKVLYVKVYNENQNVIVFQYDDEYGTEKVLSNNTIGLSNSFDTEDSKGRISRWLVEYDTNGRAVKIWYATFHNVKVPDADGIYGRQYTYDDKGRVVKEQYLSEDGSYKSTNWGLGQKLFEYKSDRISRVTYLTVDGEPSYDSAGGCMVYELEYDQYGNEIYSWYKDNEGNIMLPENYGLAGTFMTYNDEGQVVLTTNLDSDKKPYYNSGYASVQYAYDEYGYVNEVVFLDESGNITSTSSGCAKVLITNDKCGNTIEIWNKGIDGNNIEISDGYAGIKYVYDSVGNEIERHFYGANELPIELKDGTMGRRFAYDKLNRCIQVCNIDENGNLCKDNNGVAVYAYELDARGNYVKVSYLDVDGKTLVVNTTNKTAGNSSKYDENGNLIERSFFGKEGNLCNSESSSEKYARVTQEYDKNGYLIKKRYYNDNGSLVAYDSEEPEIVGYNYVRDERGNAIEYAPVSKSGGLPQGEYIIRRKFDKNDNLIETAYFAENNTATTYKKSGVHKYINEYNNRNQRVKETHYDTNGNVVLHNESKYASLRNAYNNRGQLIRRDYYGVDGSLCKTDYGYASYIYEYNVQGQNTRVLYTDVYGNPTTEDDHIPEWRYEYDKWGNCISSMSYDGHGSLLNTKANGWAIYKCEYDIRGNLLWGAYYDANNNPICAKIQKYHKFVQKFNNHGNVVEYSYWDEKQQPMLVDGVHKTNTTYNKNEQVVEESYWGTSSNKVNNGYGYQRICIEYNEDGQQVHRKYYTASDMEFATQDWIAGEWKTKFNNRIQIQNYIDANKRYLPSDYGEAYGNFTIRSLSVINDNCLGVRCSVPYSRSNLSSNDIEYFNGLLQDLVRDIWSDLPRGCSVRGTLVDYYGTVLKTYTF